MNITYEPTFNGYPINSDKERGLGCYTKGLTILQRKLESMTESHSKVLITGVVLRYPQDGSVEPSSRDITVFNKILIRDLERNNILPESGRLRGKRRNVPNRAPKHRVDPSITIVCEQHGEDKNPHAHVIIMLNGNAKRDPRDVQKRASGPGKQLSVWRTVQAWSTTAKSSTFWIVHLLAFSRQCRTRFTTIAIPSK